MVDSVKGKELLVHQYKKHLRTCPNSMINNMELFLFTVVFLPPFALFFSFSFSSSSFSLNPFSCYILWFLYPFLHPRVSQVLGVFFYPRSSLIESSTLSCKAACLLFRHHLHINAAIELAGQHLMRR